MEHKRLRASSLVPTYNGVNLLGLETFDAGSAKATIYGWAKGLQYNALASKASEDASSFQQSECFYSMWGLVDTVDIMAYDFKNILAEGQLNWFTVGAYDPLHFVGGLTVAYQ